MTHESPRTCEQVRSGHPDKLCDQIADAILDELLAYLDCKGPDRALFGRAGLEVLAKDEVIVLSGEARCDTELTDIIDLEMLIRNVVAGIGYDYSDRLSVVDLIGIQQPELQASSDRRGAGDQGIMVGYATRETPTFMPLEFVYATRICKALDDCMGKDAYAWLRPDGKAQVTLNPDLSIRKLVVGAQHSPEVRGKSDGPAIQRLIEEQLRDDFFPEVLGEAAHGAEIIVNGTGSFAIGGPKGDAGVVGRKIVCDAYGPRVAVGGGAFSGKDPTKVDRSAAYMARLIAREALLQETTTDVAVTVQVAYAIGQHQPEMITAITDGGQDLTSWVRDAYPDLSPSAIAEMLALWQPWAGGWSYRSTAAYGHFGRAGFPWEGSMLSHHRRV